MIKQSKIVISILTRDRLEYTKQTIDSLYKHTHLPFVLHITDNNSNDNMIKYLNQMEKIDHLNITYNNHNMGFATAHNKVIRRYGQFDYFVLINNDVEFDKVWLEAHIDALVSDPKLMLASSVQLNNNGIDYGARLRSDGSGYALTSSNIDPHWVSFARCVIKRDCIDKVGYLDEQFEFYYEDVDYCLRIIESGYKIKALKDIVFKHHQSSHTGDQVLMESKKKFIEKYKDFLSKL